MKRDDPGAVDPAVKAARKQKLIEKEEKKEQARVRNLKEKLVRNCLNCAFGPL